MYTDASYLLLIQVSWRIRSFSELVAGESGALAILVTCSVGSFSESNLLLSGSLIESDVQMNHISFRFKFLGDSGLYRSGVLASVLKAFVYTECILNLSCWLFTHAFSALYL